MSDPANNARDFAKNCRAYYLNSYPLTPEIISCMAQQAITLTQKLTQATAHIDALIAEIDRLKTTTNEEPK